VQTILPSSNSLKPVGRIEYVDFAKGYAILSVVIFHILQRAGLAPIWQQGISFGGAGVHLFFLLSGFGLVYGKPLPLLAFYQRRLAVVWLPYVLALSLSLLVAVIWNIFSDRWDAYFAGVLMLQMFSENYIQSFGGHFWFISTIMQFYIVFPFLLSLRSSLRTRTRFFLVCFGLSVGWWLLVFTLEKGNARIWDSFFLQFLWEFALGMILGETLRESQQIEGEQQSSRVAPGMFWEWSPWTALGIGLLFSAIMVLLVMGLGQTGKIVNDVPSLIGYTALSVFCIQGECGSTIVHQKIFLMGR
jgi:peptidoglycan/LPS O-acetylase OafA/YrhL